MELESESSLEGRGVGNGDAGEGESDRLCRAEALDEEEGVRVDEVSKDSRCVYAEGFGQAYESTE